MLIIEVLHQPGRTGDQSYVEVKHHYYESGKFIFDYTRKENGLNKPIRPEMPHPE
jgi:hypothetical protein